MSRSPQLRPILLTGVTYAWRDPHTLQIGLDPGRAILVDLPDPRAARLIALLDGSRTERTVYRDSQRLGLPPDHVDAVLDVLREAGVLMNAGSLLPSGLPEADRARLSSESAALAIRNITRHPGPEATPASGAPARAGGAPDNPAQVLRRRSAARVVLTGRGRLAAPVAVALAQAGVGRLQVDIAGEVSAQTLGGGTLTSADVGRRATDAIVDAVRRAAPGIDIRTGRRGAATLVVQFAAPQPPVLVAAGHRQRRQAYLSVLVREGTAVVGPLVLPGRPPCLACLDLHRRDRDDAWEQVTAQVVDPAPEPVAAATALAAAAYATAEILTHLDGGRAETLGATVEVSAPGRFRRRSWPPHRTCGCARRPTATRQ